MAKKPTSTATGNRRTNTRLRTAARTSKRARTAGAVHTRLIKILDTLPDAIAVLSSEGDVIACNAPYRELEAGAPDPVARQLPGGPEQHRSEDMRQITSKEVLSNGRWLRVRERRTAEGERVRLFTDVTESKQREDSVRLMFESNPVPMWIHDRDNLRFLAVNEAAICHYGYRREQFLEMTIFDLLAPEERVDAEHSLRSLLERSGEKVREHITADGGRIQVSLYSRYFTYCGLASRLVAAVDVTEQRRTVERFSHLAYHDPLTGLPNRALFRERLEEAIADAKSRRDDVGVLFLDLDRFKAINDTLGHAVGDELLCQVAARMRSCVAESDTVARLGGDEFAIVSKSSEGRRDVRVLAETLISTISRRYMIEGSSLSIGTSVGVAMAPIDGENPETLLERADQALYDAKTAGRGTFRFYRSPVIAAAL